MKVILVGPPGSGKGTQAKHIAKTYQIPHISTGDIFRANIKNETELGKLAKSYIDKGQLVPDEVTIDMVKDRLSQDDCAKGYLLDGFPRTIPQAKAFDQKESVDIILDVEVPDETCVQRIIGRGKESGGERADDNEETAKERLQVYHQQTEPIIEHYDAQGKVEKIEGTGSIDDVWASIKNALDQKASQ
ncbi:MAG: adenylate kinase [Nanoarchaeota archaeon]